MPPIVLGGIAAAKLTPGDQLRTLDGQWVNVEQVSDTGETEPVFNLEVEAAHTYFIRSIDGGHAVLVHNDSEPRVDTSNSYGIIRGVGDDSGVPVYRDMDDPRKFWYWSTVNHTYLPAPAAAVKAPASTAPKAPSGVSSLISRVSSFARQAAFKVSQQADLALSMAEGLPSAYVQTGMSGEQFDGMSGDLVGTARALTGAKIDGVQPVFGNQEAFDNGVLVGQISGFAENAILTVMGVSGVLKGVQAIKTAGGLIQVGRLVATDGRVVTVILKNGKVAVATAQTVANAGIAANAWNNILNSVADAAGGNGTGAGERNPAQDKMLSNSEIKRLQDGGEDVHELKGTSNASKRDLYKDAAGNIYVKPKGGAGPGDPTGLNINDF